MEINSGFNSIGVPPEMGEIEPEDGKVRMQKAPACPEPTGESLTAAGPAAAGDVLLNKLVEAVQGNDLADPATFADVGRQVLEETLQSMFPDDFFRNLDVPQVVATFHEYIQNDPSLNDMFQNFLNELARGMPG